MDQNQNLQNSIFELEVDNETRNSLYETAKWAKFLAIVATVCLAVFVLLFIIFGTRIGAAVSTLIPGGDTLDAGAMIIIFVLIIVAILGALTYFLMKASSGIKLGIDTNNQEALNNGLNSLRIYFMIYGIITILGTLSSLLTTF
jgi:TRAP-type C4-dicarboxylate transport system permease small subunit